MAIYDYNLPMQATPIKSPRKTPVFHSAREFLPRVTFVTVLMAGARETSFSV